MFVYFLYFYIYSYLILWYVCVCVHVEVVGGMIIRLEISFLLGTLQTIPISVLTYNNDSTRFRSLFFVKPFFNNNELFSSQQHPQWPFMVPTLGELENLSFLIEIIC